MKDNSINYYCEVMPEFDSNSFGGKTLKRLKQDQDKVWQVYKQEGSIKNKEIIDKSLSYDDANNLCNNLNSQ